MDWLLGSVGDDAGVRRTTPGLRALPVLRGFTLMLVEMRASGPVIQNRTSVGTTARVLLYVDASASMKATDEQMETQRKLRISAPAGLARRRRR